MKKSLCLILPLIAVIYLTSCTITDTADIIADTTDVTYNIESLSFISDSDEKIKVGDEKVFNYVVVKLNDKDAFSPDDIDFISENNDIVTIEYDHEGLSSLIYYKLTGIGNGETYVYAKAKDGDAVTEKLKVIVEENPYATEAAKEAEAKPEAEETPTVVPEAKPEVETEKVLKIISVTNPCENGSNATIIIIGKPNTEYTIAVYYSTKASEAEGLENATSDGNGNLSWTWKVGANTSEGEHIIKINGGDESAETSFTTYKG